MRMRMSGVTSKEASNRISLGIAIQSVSEDTPGPIAMDSVQPGLSSEGRLALEKPFFYLLLQSTRTIDALHLGV